MIGEIVDNGEFTPIENAYKIAENIAYYNIKKRLF
ncbi:hypothetical protein SDC9_149507 [bioreactor metagenome]|uniref:Uncharacterized protein n=1 Tax=bioreactor metagenome TaxID=1076179 RepID=A0A645EP23_9ZZZZ